MRKSKVLAKLRKDEFVLMTSVGFTCLSKVSEIAASIGFDCLWIDMEHRPVTYQDVFYAIQGARVKDVDTLVRIRKDSYCNYFRVLEDGATGIMVPHCRDVEDARWAVRNAKYAPQGLRGLDGVGPDTEYGLADFEQYIKNANDETFVVLQVEDKETVDDIENIAAVNGADILFVGLQDLTQSYGVRMEFEHPQIKEAIDRVAKAAKKNGKWWGLPVGDASQAETYLKKGARFFNCRGDLSLLVQGYKEIYADFKKIR